MVALTLLYDCLPSNVCNGEHGVKDVTEKEENRINREYLAQYSGQIGSSLETGLSFHTRNGERKKGVNKRMGSDTKRIHCEKHNKNVFLSFM